MQLMKYLPFLNKYIEYRKGENSKREIPFKRLKYKTKEGYKYVTTENYIFKFFSKEKTIEKGFSSDGATCARDLNTDAWLIHDSMCVLPYWNCGTPIPNIVGSAVLACVLYRDGYWIEAIPWFLATFLFGGGEMRKIGMFKAG